MNGHRAWLRSAGLSAVLAVTSLACVDASRDRERSNVTSRRQALTSPPDTLCSPGSSGGHDYWFCATLWSWQTARTKCQAIGYDLASIGSSTENAFLLSRISGNAWIGGRDSTVEGAWRWVDADTQFWDGTSSGHAVGGSFTSWKSGEPNNTLNQDCAQFHGGVGAGKWTDESCTGLANFVCEGDLCPSDPNKTEPGVCGCGVADTDGDGDGTPNCVDGCPSDSNKTVPGVCGCGTSDADSDGDGAPLCQDQCPNDARRVVAGDCGCANAPKAAGTACDDGLCAANTQCDGQGGCGTAAQCGTPDSQCTFGMRGGVGYWFCNNNRSFANAVQRCQNVNMTLAAIESAGEDSFITSKTSPLSHVYIGATDSVTEGNFFWLGPNLQFWSGGESGSRVGGAYTNWEPGQPHQGLITDTDCVVKDPPIGGGQWEVMACSSTLPFVCELNARPECDDGNFCTADTSQWNGTCSHVNAANGTSCDDNNLCTMIDACQAGMCVGSASISCDSAPHCGPAGNCDPATGGCSATGGSASASDLRLASPEQMRLAAAKTATACSSAIQEPLGVFVSGSVGAALINPVLPEQVASALACGLDAPPGTSCSAIGACTQGSVIPPTAMAICDGSAVLQKRSDGKVARVDCSKFGGTCFDSDIGAMCGVARCDPGETYRCDGQSLTACVHGVRTRSPCGRGLVCGERDDHLIGCIGAGAACSGADRCNGARAVRCVDESSTSGHEAVIDCGAMGLACAVDAGGQANCLATPGTCNTQSSPSKCVGSDLNVCVLNQWWSIGCSKLGPAGRCVPGVGVNGEAGCR